MLVVLVVLPSLLVVELGDSLQPEELGILPVLVVVELEAGLVDLLLVEQEQPEWS